jgi:tyrosyl-DNA phosphodiesterase 2
MTNLFTLANQILRRPPSLSPSFDQPKPELAMSSSNQCLYRYNGTTGLWEPISLPLLPSGAPSTGEVIPNVQVITWNVEFSSPHVEERTIGILDYIQNYITTTAAHISGIPTILLFQEARADAVLALTKHSFIQNNYDLTDFSTRNFGNYYGTVTCIPQILTPFVTSVSRQPFQNTRMGRDALTVDLGLPHNNPSFPSQPIVSQIRICNTHLESLRGHGDLARPKQLKEISQLLLSADGGLVAGDMNAIAPTDHPVPFDVGLTDAWEVMHPQATVDASHTWGYQPPHRRHLPARLDKVLYLGALAPVSIELFGVGESIEYEGSKYWLSDHYGLVAQFAVE